MTWRRGWSATNGRAIFFVGYADPASPAGRLKAAKHGETFVFSPSAGRVTQQLRDAGF